jgi:alkylated DNA nucleotide flippase Atl1
MRHRARCRRRLRRQCTHGRNPCHRVVKADGSVAGYRWVVQRKRSLPGGSLASRRDTIPV